MCCQKLQAPPYPLPHRAPDEFPWLSRYIHMQENRVNSTERGDLSRRPSGRERIAIALPPLHDDHLLPVSDPLKNLLQYFTDQLFPPTLLIFTSYALPDLFETSWQQFHWYRGQTRYQHQPEPMRAFSVALHRGVRAGYDMGRESRENTEERLNAEPNQCIALRSTAGPSASNKRCKGDPQLSADQPTFNGILGWGGK